jgi:hypothetical protein
MEPEPCTPHVQGLDEIYPTYEAGVNVELPVEIRIRGRREGRIFMKIKLLSLLGLALFFAGCQQPTWEELSSSEGAFSIFLPGSPTELTRTVNTAAGPIDFHFFLLEQKDIAYLVGYSDYPEIAVQKTNPEAILEGARNGAVASAQGKLLSELIISLNGYPGRELKIEPAGGEGTINTNMFVVDNRLYQVMVVTPKEKAFSKHVGKFLDSFKLLGK